MTTRALISCCAMLWWGCSKPESVPEASAARSASALVNIWQSPSDTLVRGGIQSPPVWDGTEFWLLAYGTDLGSWLRRFDGAGVPIDDGGLRLSTSSASRLVVVGGKHFLIASELGSDGGVFMVSRLLAADGTLDPPTELAPSLFGLAFGASGGPEGKLLLQSNPGAGLTLVREVDIGPSGGLLRPVTSWPTTTTTIQDLDFDGVQFVALGRESDGGLTLSGLSGPSMAPRFDLPVPIDITSGITQGTFGGSSSLGAVVAGNQVQLISLGALLGTPLAFPTPCDAYRDGAELVVLSCDMGTNVGLRAARVSGGGGVGPVFQLVPPRTPAPIYANSMRTSAPALSTTGAFVPWAEFSSGTATYAALLPFGSPVLSAKQPVLLEQRRAIAAGAVEGAPLATWLGELTYPNESVVFATRLGTLGGLDPTPLVVALPGFPKLDSNFFDNSSNPAAASSATEWLIVWSNSFALWARRLAFDGTFPAAEMQLQATGSHNNAAVGYGAGVYLATSVGFGLRLSRISAAGVVQNPGGTQISPNPFTLNGGVAFDGTNFQAVAAMNPGAGAGEPTWFTITPAGGITGPVALSSRQTYGMRVKSGNGRALAAWSEDNPDGGPTLMQLVALSSGVTPLGSWASSLINYKYVRQSISIVENDTGIHIALNGGDVNSIEWVDFWSDGGVRLGHPQVKPASVVSLQALPDGGLLLMHGDYEDRIFAQAQKMSVLSVEYRSEGAACSGDLDCADLRCFQGSCCLACVVIDAGVPDAGFDGGAADSGAPDAGGALDAGDPDAGAADAAVSLDASVDAGAVDAGAVDAGAVDAGVTDPDAGISDAGQTDGSVVSDAGEQPDAGGGARLIVGCGCSSAGGDGFGALCLLLMAMAYRRAARQSSST